MIEPATLHITPIDRLSSIDAASWDFCAGPDDPFISYAFLRALEESGAATAQQGWHPQHLIARDQVDGPIIAVMPGYLKSHSYGEYIFDHAWADAYHRAGGNYYPKFLSAVPFTPVSGRRCLVAPTHPGTGAGLDQATIIRAMLTASQQLARQLGLSSAHINFIDPSLAQLAEACGFLLRDGHQYHWFNQGYADFDNFLAALSSRKRKNIRKERQSILEAGITTTALSGSDLTEDIWDIFYDFYQDTYDRKWGRPYLTRAFFSQIGASMGKQIVLMMAYQAGKPIAAALNLRGTDCLYGRNWGCRVDIPNLHFELCYYAAIDYAIAHGLARVEAGTQGEHKLQRGYIPVKTQSAHWIAHPEFHDAVADYLVRERAHTDEMRTHLAEYAPYRQVAP